MPSPSCSRWPPAGWRTRRPRHDAPRPDAGSVLHPAHGRAAPGQPPHHRLIPRHLAAVPRLHPGENRHPSRRTRHRRHRCRPRQRIPRPPGSRPRQHRTRNARLAAIRSFFKFAALRHPEHAGTIARVLAIPAKKHGRTSVSYLTAGETKALLAAPDTGTWHGRRDHALLALAAQTGLRSSELTGLTRGDVQTGTGPTVRCHGKGRKDRVTPLTANVAAVIRTWLREQPGVPGDPLFPTRTGRRLSSDAVQDLVERHVATAAAACPSIRDKHVTPHTLRHSAAMALLHAGVDPVTIALWMGHESPRSTQPYIHADLKLKEKALARTSSPTTKTGRYRPPDKLLAFLEGLGLCRPPDMRERGRQGTSWRPRHNRGPGIT